MTPKAVIAGAADTVLLPLTILSAAWLRVIRQVGLRRMPFSKKVFDRIGVFPIRDQYYEPLWNPRRLRMPLCDDRQLPGLKLNVAGQLELLARFRFSEELKEFPLENTNREPAYYYHNGAYESGDAEYLYSVIRLLKPSRLFEIGSGFSTLMARAAVLANQHEDSKYECQHLCVEPYQHPWLSDLGITVIRNLVECLDARLFAQLRADDILFIDSSHIIRPQGDVLWIYQNVIPSLQPGVAVHVHDVFTPKDYPAKCLCEARRMWNEQYLLEAFLTFNDRFEVIGSLNYLAHHHRAELADKLPIFAREAAGREPGAFWLRSL